jgi:hypothetical protein
LFSAKMDEIHLKMVEYALFKFDHKFWVNFVQFGGNLTHGRFLGADSVKIRPISKHFDQVKSKMVVDFQLRIFDRF